MLGDKEKLSNTTVIEMQGRNILSGLSNTEDINAQPYFSTGEAKSRLGSTLRRWVFPIDSEGLPTELDVRQQNITKFQIKSKKVINNSDFVDYIIFQWYTAIKAATEGTTLNQDTMQSILTTNMARNPLNNEMLKSSIPLGKMLGELNANPMNAAPVCLALIRVGLMGTNFNVLGKSSTNIRFTVDHHADFALFRDLVRSIFGFDIMKGGSSGYVEQLTALLDASIFPAAGEAIRVNLNNLSSYVVTAATIVDKLYKDYYPSAALIDELVKIAVFLDITDNIVEVQRQEGYAAIKKYSDLDIVNFLRGTDEYFSQFEIVLDSLKSKTIDALSVMMLPEYLVDDTFGARTSLYAYLQSVYSPIDDFKKMRLSIQVLDGSTAHSRAISIYEAAKSPNSVAVYKAEIMFQGNKTSSSISAKIGPDYKDDKTKLPGLTMFRKLPIYCNIDRISDHSFFEVSSTIMKYILGDIARGTVRYALADSVLINTKDIQIKAPESSILKAILKLSPSRLYYSFPKGKFYIRAKFFRGLDKNSVASYGMVKTHDATLYDVPIDKIDDKLLKLQQPDVHNTGLGLEIEREGKIVTQNHIWPEVLITDEMNVQIPSTVIDDTALLGPSPLVRITEISKGKTFNNLVKPDSSISRTAGRDYVFSTFNPTISDRLLAKVLEFLTDEDSDAYVLELEEIGLTVTYDSSSFKMLRSFVDNAITNDVSRFYRENADIIRNPIKGYADPLTLRDGIEHIFTLYLSMLSLLAGAQKATEYLPKNIMLDSQVI